MVTNPPARSVMRNSWNYLFRCLATMLCLWCAAGMGYAQLPLHLFHGSGTFRLGVVRGNESRWLDQCEMHANGRTYRFTDALWKGGEISLTCCPLTDSEGCILALEGKQLPDDLSVCWAFGACHGDEAFPEAATHPGILPAACHDNVFSVEGQAFTVYYGAVMRLRVVQGVVPPGTEARLCDAHQQASPLALYHSGKQTDAPVISALFPWAKAEKRYFCLYKQNAKADYNYFQLPALFEKELKASLP